MNAHHIVPHANRRRYVTHGRRNFKKVSYKNILHFVNLINLTRFAAFIIVLIATISSAAAQLIDDSNYFYARVMPAISMYHGDLISINYDKPYAGFAYKWGFGYVVSPYIDVVFDYRVADYPRTERPSVGDYTRNHTANLYATYRFMQWREFELYALAGAGMTFFGTHDRADMFKPAFGPVIGTGVEFELSDRVQLFVEGTLDLVLDDEAMDERKGDKGFDALGLIGAGVRINLRSSFRSIDGVDIDGPDTVAVRQSFTIHASVEGNPTQPVMIQWNFNDGTRIQGQSVVHVFRMRGTYTVTVTASNWRSEQQAEKEIVVE